ncbi:MAG: transcription elongation factor GreA [Pseudomonadales bacterium]|jgi:transcription elongation factor GreA|nr:transcription elongation factor GreA [Gammaproteobacteria bacterium]MDP6024516.1 transcription elongation factor GreA [Pseudomonadales bacterium]MDP6317350.1 transcription elongation factor GreA [Pseudomonadales bacterium]MDP7313306.1 transcription elongation factor GreA [Pseudomonadales bacterium]MDP7576250.1 transcription elongation factor GreA [Pseudomonadales bacterium]|tara:strand:+ start:198 stop:674 length:477 start_codon:yes stop_codon:yes gene_type:complete
MDKIPMTANGERALRQELDNLKQVERPRVVQAIAEARAQGDLRENSEYQYAKEEQGFIEGRIVEIGGKLSHAQVIDVTSIPPSGKVIFGTTVRLMNLDNEAEVIYQIVGDDEADIKVNKISVYSPIARALIGKEVDDVVVVKAPSGDIEYEICAVEHV